MLFTKTLFSLPNLPPLYMISHNPYPFFISSGNKGVPLTTFPIDTHLHLITPSLSSFRVIKINNHNSGLFPLENQFIQVFSGYV